MNDRAIERVEQLIDQANVMAIKVHEFDDGARVIDAGVAVPGSLEAGVQIAEICMAGLGTVDLVASNRIEGWAFDVNVRASQAVVACLGSQYAGWLLSATGDGGESSKWHGMASGPGRALSLKEELFADLAFSDGESSGEPGAVLVIESDSLPPPTLSTQIAKDCGVAPQALTFLVTPTGSLAGSVQIAARVVEVALHKAHAVGFDLTAIHDGLGSAPLPPTASDSMLAMGRTNDAILFGGTVHLFVECDDASASDLAKALPSSNSKDYGKPFGQVFKDYDYDFFKIDPHLFSPAHIRVTNVQSGKTFESGKIDDALLAKSFDVDLL